MTLDAGDNSICAIDLDGKRMAWRPPTEPGRATSSTCRELAAAMLGLATFSDTFSGCKVALLTDSTGCAGALHGGRAEGDGDAVVKEIYEVAEDRGTAFCSFWLCREKNVESDRGSKCRTAEEPPPPLLQGSGHWPSPCRAVRNVCLGDRRCQHPAV